MVMYHIRDFPVEGAALWRTLCLRSAGVPFELWKRVYDARDVVAVADRALDTEAPGTAEDTVAAALEKHWTTLSERLRTIDLSLVGSAIVWQNPAAYRHGLVPLLEGRYRDGSSKFRKKLMDVTLYMQRYVAKNDSIGFFGPIGWGMVGDTAEFVSASQEDEIIETSFAHLEQWPIEALITTHVVPTKLREHVPPMLSPHVHLNASQLQLPLGATISLDDHERAVLQQCDGQRTAAAIARKVGDDQHGISREAALATLARFTHANHVTWRLPVQPILNPEVAYRRFLESTPPSPSRQVALDALDELLTATSSVALDARSPPQLEKQLAAVHQAFEEQTGTSSYRDVRRRGYGRTILCLEARRAIRLSAGSEFLSSLREPLAPLLRSAGWFLAEARRRFAERLETSFCDLSPAGDPLSLADLWYANLDIWFRSRSVLLRPIVEELQRRWETLLPELATGQTRLAVRTAEIEDRVATLFEADGSGWALWPYCCPDLLPRVPADSEDGESLVLGELHIARNTINVGVFYATHPKPCDLRHTWEEDHSGGRSVRFVGNPLEYPPRGLPCLGSAEDLVVTTTPGVVGRDPASTQPLSAFLVERHRDGSLVARHRREPESIWPLMHFLADPLSASVTEEFSPFGRGAHTPRITIDNLVVARESYRLSHEALRPLIDGSPGSRYLAARRLHRELDLPRFVFVRCGDEKPMMLDLDSPASVEAIARRFRRDEMSDRPVALTEMLPRPDELWLRDAAGQAYTSEIRTVVHMPGGSGDLWGEVPTGVGPVSPPVP